MKPRRLVSVRRGELPLSSGGYVKEASGDEGDEDGGHASDRDGHRGERAGDERGHAAALEDRYDLLDEGRKPLVRQVLRLLTRWRRNSGLIVLTGLVLLLLLLVTAIWLSLPPVLHNCRLARTGEGTAPNGGVDPGVPEYLSVVRGRLAFNPGGTFTIVQFADLHYTNGAEATCLDLTPDMRRYPCSDDNTTDFMRRVLDAETPDLVVMTGDNVHGSHCHNVTWSMQAWRVPMEERGIPWMITFGNHDEDLVTKAAMMEVDRASKLSLSLRGPPDISGGATYAYTVATAAAMRAAKEAVSSEHRAKGVGNAWSRLTQLKRHRKESVDESEEEAELVAAAVAQGGDAFAIVVIDSGGDLYGKNGRFAGYDWVHGDQLEWLFQTAKSPAVKGLPMLVFQHIPFPEYLRARRRCTIVSQLLNSQNGFQVESDEEFGGGAAGAGGMGGTGGSGGGGEGAVCSGAFKEGIGSPRSDCGTFKVLHALGSVRMVNVGHDHVNDFCAALGGIRLCYGGSAGYGAYGRKGVLRRARVIRLHENGTIETWKRLDAFSSPPYTRIDYETF